MKITDLFCFIMTLSVKGYASALPTDSIDMSKAASPSILLSPRVHLTNAERMQRGIPLNPPLRRQLSLSTDSILPTPSAKVGVSGRLFVVPSDTTLCGYISNVRDEKGRYVISTDKEDALEVILSNHELIPMGGTYERLGTTFGEMYQATPVGPGNNAFEGNLYNFAVLTGTSSGTYGQSAHSGETSYVPAPNNFIESAIFRLDSQNNEILPTWVNPDGSPRPSTFGISGDGPLSPLFISMNIGAFNSRYGGSSARIFLV